MSIIHTESEVTTENIYGGRLQPKHPSMPVAYPTPRLNPLNIPPNLPEKLQRERPVGLFHCWPSLSLFYVKHTSQSPTKVLLMIPPQGWCLRCIKMSEAQCLIHLKHFLSTTTCSKTCCVSGVQGNFPQTYSDRWRVYNDLAFVFRINHEALSLLIRMLT